MRLTKQILPLLLLSILPGLYAETTGRADFDETPMPVKSVAPAYPVEMKHAGVSGLVTVTITIDENGDVTESVVAKSSRTEFESPAIEAVAKWKFKPAKKAGVAVKARIRIPIKFDAEG